ncbi:ABC transporter permease [Pseudomonas muyukensis]|uniref:ABC transporter permease n=1 Tax=Pseudomonas muyukensis TaxID=2842357 RepID=A0ABX8MBP1_9PSED|nr:ABC transporter permease [Pseudomonas muyukensis]QXH35709.1 ABC transporter permease [Pseudomonas muyukensis]
MTDSAGYGPSPWQRLAEPCASLQRLGRRALLALLGIAVGCAAVVALLNIGHNAQAQAMAVFQDMGSDLLVANVQLPAGVSPSSADRLDDLALRQRLPEVQALSALSLTSMQGRRQGRSFDTLLAGVGAELDQVLDLVPAQGRWLSRFDAQATHAVLGAQLAASLAAQGQPAVPGESVQLAGYVFQVIGILQPHGQNPLLPLSIDDTLLVPLQGMRRLAVAPQIGTVLARSVAGVDPQALAPRLQDALRASLPGRDIEVQVPQQLLAGIAQQSRLFTWLLGGLGGIALLVGGVGVMNVMLMNVSERRREIGVRMALGARPRDIAWLFLLEALALALAGAAAGALLGLAAGWLFGQLSGWGAFTLAPLALPLGIGGALLTGLVFGLSPALAAARLQPVQALRDD